MYSDIVQNLFFHFTSNHIIYYRNSTIVSFLCISMVRKNSTWRPGRRQTTTSKFTFAMSLPELMNESTLKNHLSVILFRQIIVTILFLGLFTLICQTPYHSVHYIGAPMHLHWVWLRHRYRYGLCMAKAFRMTKAGRFHQPETRTKT